MNDSEIVAARMSPEDKARIQAMADEEGLSLSQFVRYRLLKESPKWQENIQALTLGMENIQNFIQTILENNHETT